MNKRHIWRATRAAGSGIVVAALMSASFTSPAKADPPATLADSGGILGWGATDSSNAYTLPEDLSDTAFSAVAAAGSFAVALTAAGKVVVLGKHPTPGVDIEVVPAAVSDKVTIAVAASRSNANAGAVTSDGKVHVWGRSDPDNDLDPSVWDVPTGLSDVRDIALSGDFGTAIKNDGSVVVWGDNTHNLQTVPDLASSDPAKPSGAKSLAVTNDAIFALKNDGTVVAWGRANQNQTVLPAELSIVGNVKAVAARTNGGLALLANGTMVSWGAQTTTPATNKVPAAVAGKNVVAIATGGVNAAVDDQGVLYTWGQATQLTNVSAAPAALAGSAVTQLAMGGSNYMLAITSGLKKATAPGITGTAKDGQTLTASAGTFSGSPSAVTGQWLANNVAIDGKTDTELALTPDLIGKTITYSSTAMKGLSTLASVSEPTAAVAANIIESITRVSVATKAYGSASTVTVNVGNSGGKTVTGTVTLSGAGASQTRPVAGGRATFSLPRTLAPRAYSLAAKYSGNSELSASTATGRLTIAKGKASAIAFKANKAPTSKKKGKATVTVAAPSGLAKSSGKITVTLKKGSSKKIIKSTLLGGKRSIVLPKLKKGTWKVIVSYAGDSNYGSAVSKSYSLKVKK